MTTSLTLPAALPTQRARPCGARAALFLLLLLVCTAPVGAGVQDGPQQLAAMALKQLNQGIKDYELDQIEEALRDLDSVYLKVDAKTVKKIVKGLGRLLSLEVRQEERWDELPPEDDLLPLYRMTVGILYDKPEGRGVLTAALKKGHIKRWPEVQAVILEGMGFRGEPQNLKLFGGYLDHESAAVVSAAAGALGQYSEADQDLRRSAVKELTAAFLAHHRTAQKEKRRGKQEDAQGFFILVEGSFNKSLTSLTRQRFGDPESWSAWFSEHGAEDTW